jgi:hypothetical protein
MFSNDIDELKKYRDDLRKDMNACACANSRNVSGTCGVCQARVHEIIAAENQIAVHSRAQSTTVTQSSSPTVYSPPIGNQSSSFPDLDIDFDFMELDEAWERAQIKKAKSCECGAQACRSPHARYCPLFTEIPGDY